MFFLRRRCCVFASPGFEEANRLVFETQSGISSQSTFSFCIVFLLVLYVSHPRGKKCSARRISIPPRQLASSADGVDAADFPLVFSLLISLPCLRLFPAPSTLCHVASWTRQHAESENMEIKEQRKNRDAFPTSLPYSVYLLVISL